MSELFNKISACLAAISSDVRQGKTPHGKCNKLILCLESLGENLDEQERGAPVRLDEMLCSICGVDDLGKVLKKLKNGKEKETCLGEIEEASGKFRVLANLIEPY